jgi:hypothetical protein
MFLIPAGDSLPAELHLIGMPLLPGLGIHYSLLLLE